MIKLNLTIVNRQKSVKLNKNLRSLLKRGCFAVLVEEDFKQNAEAGISIVDNTKITQLNEQYRNKKGPTDVLSFGGDGQFEINPDTGFCILGDIVISAEKALEQAGLYGHSFEREMTFLCIHSMLHLLGYDHEKSRKEELETERKQKNILAKILA